MPSPFPGMDPWLEDVDVYADLRFSMVVLLSEALNAVLPVGYVSIISHISDDIDSVDAESYVQIVALSLVKDQTPLTAIELPQRCRNWRECRAPGNWKGGRILIRLFREKWSSEPPLAPQIVTCTSHSDESECIEVETIDYTNQLPFIRVPWELGKPPLDIALQPILNRIYDSGRYPLRVSYDQPCDPPLSPEQQTWADGILREKGLLK